MRIFILLSACLVGLCTYTAEGLQLIGLIFCLIIISVQFMNNKKEKNIMMQLKGHYYRLYRFIHIKNNEFPSIADEK